MGKMEDAKSMRIWLMMRRLIFCFRMCGIRRTRRMRPLSTTPITPIAITKPWKIYATLLLPLTTILLFEGGSEEEEKVEHSEGSAEDSFEYSVDPFVSNTQISADIVCWLKNKAYVMLCYVML